MKINVINYFAVRDKNSDTYHFVLLDFKPSWFERVFLKKEPVQLYVYSAYYYFEIEEWYWLDSGKQVHNSICRKITNFRRNKQKEDMKKIREENLRKTHDRANAIFDLSCKAPD